METWGKVSISFSKDVIVNSLRYYSEIKKAKDLMVCASYNKELLVALAKISALV